jgi:hypothetical protein
MTTREAARRYGAIGERAAAGFATILLHHCVGHDPACEGERSSFAVEHAPAKGGGLTTMLCRSP